MTVNATMQTGATAAASCPKCGGLEISARCDGYVLYAVKGFDDERFPVLSNDPDLQTFDDRTYICGDCGYGNARAEAFLAES